MDSAEQTARPNLGNAVPSIPQGSEGNVSVENLISEDDLDPCLERVFGRQIPPIVSQLNPSIPGSLSPGVVDIVEEERRQNEEL